MAAGCSLFERNGPEGGRPVARAFDQYLYEEDLADIIPEGTNVTDSTRIADNYIDNWIKQQVVLHKAETNLPDQRKRVEKQLREYRNSLITFAYEQELVRQQLDTVVTDDEIAEYYDSNRANFELKDDILKALYVRVKQDAPRLEELRGWVRSGEARHLNQLEEYCHQFALDFILDDETWMRLDDLLNKLPLEAGQRSRLLGHNRYVELQDSTDLYLVRIAEHRLKDSASPLSFERINIRGMIINKRKLKLIRAMEKAAYEQAFSNNDFEVFADEKE